MFSNLTSFSNSLSNSGTSITNSPTWGEKKISDRREALREVCPRISVPVRPRGAVGPFPVLEPARKRNTQAMDLTASHGGLCQKRFVNTIIFCGRR